MSYYYFIASLPALVMGQTPISDEVFRARCEAELSPRDYRTVLVMDDIPLPENVVQNSFANTWNDLETQLRNAIAKMRASKRQTDAARVLRSHGGYATIIEDHVESAWSHANPLERERSLDTLRWKLLDDLTGPDPFSFNVILAYAVKRKIAERWSMLDEDAGWKKAQEALEQQPAHERRHDDHETADTNVGSQT